MDIQPLITLDEIIKRPGMYMPARSIYCLKALVDGINSDEQTDVWDYLDGFYDWLLETFNHTTGSQGEMKLILHYLSADPYDAFDHFFELAREFKQGEEELPLFKAMQTDPYAYLPEKSIYCLYAFFWGKDFASQQQCPTIDLVGFEEWIQNRFGLEGSWYKTILFYSQDEFGALQRFTELYREYAAEAHHASDQAPM